MTAGESTAHTGTLDEAFAHVGKRHEAKSLDDRTSLSHSMMDDDVRSEATGSIKYDLFFLLRSHVSCGPPSPGDSQTHP